MKYLGIDFGDKRIGLAIGSSGTAVPYNVVVNNQSTARDIADLVAREGIGAVVVGMPRSLSGASNERTQKTMVFIEKLKKWLKVPLDTEDERLTTAAARARGARSLDATAAAEILQSYLDRHARTCDSV